MKRFLVLLVVVAGGLAWAAFGVPSNAAVVNGQAISQTQVDQDVSVIANTNSNDYWCYLRGQEAVESSGRVIIGPPNGVGQQTSDGPRTSATTSFVSSYISTAVGHQLVDELAAQYRVHVSPSDLKVARTQFAGEISSIMEEVAGSQYECSTGSTPLTGTAVLATLPSWFVNEQVRFFATIADLEQSISGLGTSTSDLQAYFDAHKSQFDTACFTVAQYTSESAAEATKAAVYEGGSFAKLAPEQTNGGPQGCDVLASIVAQLPANAGLTTLPLNTLSNPIEVDGSYLLVEITSRSSTPFAKAESAVKQAVAVVENEKANTAIDKAERKASVTVDPRYGTWQAENAAVLVPPSPLPADVLDAGVNSAVAASTAGTAASS